MDHEVAKKQFYAKLKALEKTRGIQMPKLPSDKKASGLLAKSPSETESLTDAKPSPPPVTDEPAPGSRTPDFAASKTAGLFEDKANPNIKSKLLFGGLKDKKSDDKGNVFKPREFKPKDSKSVFPGVGDSAKSSDNPFSSRTGASKATSSLFSDDVYLPSASPSVPGLEKKPSKSTHVFETKK